MLTTALTIKSCLEEGYCSTLWLSLFICRSLSTFYLSVLSVELNVSNIGMTRLQGCLAPGVKTSIVNANAVVATAASATASATAGQ